MNSSANRLKALDKKDLLSRASEELVPAAVLSLLVLSLLAAVENSGTKAPLSESERLALESLDCSKPVESFEE